jgi:hypothetical protein
LKVFSRMRNLSQDTTYYSDCYKRLSTRRDSTYILFQNPDKRGKFVQILNNFSDNNIGKISCFLEFKNQFYVSLMVLHWDGKAPQRLDTINYFSVTESSSTDFVLLPVENIKQLTCLLPMEKENKKIFISVPNTLY